jgi:glycosyltransferase involved in cell wall biosynthesis
MRVLIVHTSTLPSRMGGSERVVWELARGLVARCHEPRILVPLTTRSLPARSTIDGITVVRYHDPFMSWRAVLPKSQVVADAGLLSPEGDVEALRARLRTLLSDHAVRERLIERGRGRVAQHYTHEVGAAA